jgi:regulator of protease activity HflC (stomatin/prohibitin superfamily)
MLYIITLTVGLIFLTTIAAAVFRYKRMWVVGEDSIAVTVNHDGFFKRMLPAGRHMLHPFEKVEFTFETKTKFAGNRAASVATSDGIMVHINWSSTFVLQPDLITQNLSQRLRSLPNADRAMTRHTDICLRKLVGNCTLQDLFKPATRENIEHDLRQLLSERLNPMGIAIRSLFLQAIELPPEVIEAFNKAKAIETLDNAIRQIDPTTREIVRGAYQLDEILHWDAYLPGPSRLAMKRLQAVAH